MRARLLLRKQRIRATLSLIKQRGWSANITNLFVSFFIPPGVIYTIIQFIEQNLDFQIKLTWLIIIYLALFIAVIISMYIKTRTLLLKDFNLRENYKITISIDDYIDNTKKYPRATYVAGINDQFDLSKSAVGASLLSDLLDTFYQKNQDKFNLQKQFTETIEGYVDNGLKYYGERPGKTFKHGSIISDKFMYKEIPRNILFFANSSVKGKGEFNGAQKTTSTLKLIWAYMFKKDIKSDQLVMPLLGTGFSRDTTPMASTIAIIDQFFAKSYPTDQDLTKYQQLVPHIVISIQPEMIIDKKVDLFAVHRYIEVMNERLEYGFTKEIIYKSNIESDEKDESDDCDDD